MRNIEMVLKPEYEMHSCSLYTWSTSLKELYAIFLVCLHLDCNTSHELSTCGITLALHVWDFVICWIRDFQIKDAQLVQCPSAKHCHSKALREKNDTALLYTNISFTTELYVVWPRMLTLSLEQYVLVG